MQTSWASNEPNPFPTLTRRSRARRSLAIFALTAAILTAFWTSMPVGAQGTTGTASTTSSAVSATVPSPAATSQAAAVGATAGQTVLLDPGAAGSFQVNAKSYVLYEAESDTFLLGRDPDTPRSPASITKVMTVLLALEHLQLTDTITVTRDMYATIPNDYMRLGLVEGEELPVEDAIYASLLLSANDTAMALAFKVSGSVSAFTDLMNQRARALGCTGTTFTNPYGLAEPTNLTTAHDMALIMAEALRNETYVKVSLTKSRQFKPTNKAGARGVGNGNRFVTTTRFAYPAFIGGKTGFTNLSGNTMVSGARQDGRTLIVVILGATASDPRYIDTIALFNHGFSAYGKAALEPADFSAARDQSVARLEARLKEAGLRFEVNRADLTLNPHATLPKAASAGDFVGRVEERPVDLQSVKAGQSLDYPLLADFEGGFTVRVGSLSLSLVELPPEPVPVASTGAVTSATMPGDETAPRALGSTLLRIGGIVLAVLLVISAVVVIMMQRERKRRRRNRSRPRIRRL